MATSLTWLSRTFCRTFTAFLHISLPSLHDYNVKLLNFTFFGGRKQKTTTFFFSSCTWIKSFRIQLQKNFANISRIERDRIRAIKFKAARIQFSSDVFVAVRRRCCLSSLLTFRKPVQSSEAKGVVSLASRCYLTIVIDLICQSSLEVRHVIAGRPRVKP